MPAALPDALRERLDSRTLLGWTAVLGVLWYVFDPSPVQVATTVASLAIFGVTNLLADVYDLREAVTHVGLGVYALVGAAALSAVGDGGFWLPLLFGLAGGWLVLDAVQTARHEGLTEPDDERDGHEVYRNYVARRVHETLADGPLTRRELDDRLDADAAAIDDAIARLRDRDVIVREGSELRVRSHGQNWSDRVLEWARNRARRVARPVTLELAGRTGGTGRESTAARADGSPRDDADASEPDDGSCEPERAGGD